MTIEEHFANAFADFEALVAKGSEPDAAIAEAAEANGISRENLVTRLTRSETIEARIERIRQTADRARFVALLDREAANAKRREGVYARARFNVRELVSATLAAALGRPLSDHETWLVEEKLSPWISELKLARSARSTPLRKLSLNG